MTPEEVIAIVREFDPDAVSVKVRDRDMASEIARLRAQRDAHAEQLRLQGDEIARLRAENERLMEVDRRTPLGTHDAALVKFGDDGWIVPKPLAAEIAKRVADMADLHIARLRAQRDAHAEQLRLQREALGREIIRTRDEIAALRTENERLRLVAAASPVYECDMRDEIAALRKWRDDHWADREAWERKRAALEAEIQRLNEELDDEYEPPEPDYDAHRIGDSVTERRDLDDAGRGHLKL